MHGYIETVKTAYRKLNITSRKKMKHIFANVTKIVDTKVS